MKNKKVALILATVLTLCMFFGAFAACDDAVVKIYSVTFDAQNGTENVKIKFDSDFAMPTDPEKEGYSFGGWYTDSACSDGNEWSMPETLNENITIYAKWSNSQGDQFDVTLKDGVSSDTLYVKKVENLSDGFIMGMDASAVISLENSGVKYYNFDGQEEDVFKILADNGVNTIRVRVWNNPYDSNGNGFGGGNCDINTALEIGKRATKYGMNLMVDFHYSDFWADPSKQQAPRDWEDLKMETTKSDEENQRKPDALYEYTKECLQKLADAGVKVSVVQVGNETNSGLAGETVWRFICQLMNAGSKAVREVYPQAQVAVHFANPESGKYNGYAQKLDYWGVDYDIFASSYYPYWHGTLENLSEVLSKVATDYGKKVMVAETSYAYTGEDTDFYGNTIGDGTDGVIKSYPYTVQGQANSVRNIIECVANTTNGIGVCYWEGTWISVGGEDWGANSVLWEKYGSGWASSYASVYDPNDAGQYYGGCAVDNQAFFDKNGKALESLKVFALVKNGNTVENKADALEDVTLYCDLNGTIELPATVNAVMLDDSKQAVEVTWNITDDDIAAMYAGGAAKYAYTGTAAGMTVNINISMLEKNFLENYSFEEDIDETEQPENWKMTSESANSSNLQMYVSTVSTNALTGTNTYHFWGKDENSVNFDLEQEITGLKSGKYKYSISIMGGNGGTTNIYAYVKINGVIVETKTMVITSWGSDNWDTALIEDIEYTEGDTISVGIHVECQGTGEGAWGNIDDALFNSVAE